MSSGFYRSFSITALLMTFLKELGAISPVLQRLILHTIQPLLVAAIFYVGSLFVHHPLYWLILIPFLMYFLYSYYEFYQQNIQDSEKNPTFPLKDNQIPITVFQPISASLSEDLSLNPSQEQELSPHVQLENIQITNTNNSNQHISLNTHQNNDSDSLNSYFVDHSELSLSRHDNQNENEEEKSLFESESYQISSESESEEWDLDYDSSSIQQTITSPRHRFSSSESIYGIPFSSRGGGGGRRRSSLYSSYDLDEMIFDTNDQHSLNSSETCHEEEDHNHSIE